MSASRPPTSPRAKGARPAAAPRRPQPGAVRTGSAGAGGSGSASTGKGTSTRKGTSGNGTTGNGTTGKGASGKGTGGEARSATSAAPDAGSAPRVSTTSAQRFARRVVWRRRKRILLGSLALAVAAGLVWLVLGSPWLRVRDVRVSGTVRVDPQQIRALARADLGRPMALADPQRLAQDVAGIHVVKHVRVDRSYPDTLTVVVLERSPVAAVPSSGGGYSLVDAEGVLVESARAVPTGLPVMQVDLVHGGAPALRAALAVRASLPGTLSSQVRAMGADGADAVWLVLKDRSRVLWGGPEDAALKAAVLTALQGQKAKEYDVSAPNAPAIRGSH